MMLVRSSQKGPRISTATSGLHAVNIAFSHDMNKPDEVSRVTSGAFAHRRRHMENILVAICSVPLHGPAIANTAT
jgi:hypothetical protein